jgi:hypothetical protein
LVTRYHAAEEVLGDSSDQVAITCLVAAVRDPGNPKHQAALHLLSVITAFLGPA